MSEMLTAALDEAQWLAPVYALPRLTLARASGSTVWDSDGRAYLDWTSGIAVLAFGHAPAGLLAAVGAQMATLGHCSNLFANAPATELARELCEATGYARTFFCNSGTEGIDAALKFARARAAARGDAGRDVLAFTGGFHGRTGFALSATHKLAYRAPFAPLIPGVRFAAFNDIEALDAAIDGDICAILVEPVQGEAGAIPADAAFLRELRRRADACGAVLIFDEIQSGMGRTGHLLAATPSGVRADVTVLSKALGGGLPIGAVLMTEEVAAHLAPGMHGTTFGGQAPAAAAARWVLGELLRPGLLESVRARGAELRAALEQLATRHAAIRAVRGAGLLLALDLAPHDTRTPDALIAAARDAGLLLVRGGDTAVRILPSLIADSGELRDGVARLERALDSFTISGGLAQ